jgi:surfactin synthase thioesterase subunit
VLIASGMSRNEQNQKNYKKDTGIDLNELIRKASSVSPDHFIDVPKFIYCDNPRVTAEAFISEYADDRVHSTPLNIAKVTDIPILAIGGTQDTVVSDLEGDFVNLADRSNFSIEMIDGADHFFRDLYADDAASLIAEMIEGLE